MEPADETTRRLDMPPRSAAAEAVAARIGTRYALLAEVGSGGMGMVYRARDRETNEMVALKVLRPEISGDPAMMARFINELKLARRITHKNVCRIYDFSRVNDLALITMEYVEGETLRDLLRRTGRLPAARAVDIARQICAGLAEAHAQNVVHRDLKPENVMIGPDGTVKLMDFGIARAVGGDAAATQTMIGTPAYMAPEQAQGGPLDARTDIYALGLIVYECLTGRRAFSGPTPVAVALAQLRDRPVAPHKLAPATPRPLEALVLRCLEKDPAARFRSAAELAAALDGHTPVAARGRGRGRWFAAAVVVLAVAVLTVLTVGIKRFRAGEPGPTVATAPAPPAMPAAAPAGPTMAPGERAKAMGEGRTTERVTRLLEAAKAGDPRAQTRIAVFLLEGPEATRNPAKAARWLDRAARAGFAEAQFRLGRLYEEGQGVDADPLAAYRWYYAAGAGGHTRAAEAAARIAGTLTDEQRARAEQQMPVRGRGPGGGRPAPPPR